MKNLRATIHHHSISRARVVDLETTDLRIAKRRASAEFRGDFLDYSIVILGERTPDNPNGILSSRQIKDRRWCDTRF